VSYVNELDSSKALGSLRAWVEHNPKYHGVEVEPDEYSDGSLMDDVLQLMQRAEAHSEGRDPDVQVVRIKGLETRRKRDDAYGTSRLKRTLGVGLTTYVCYE